MRLHPHRVCIDDASHHLDVRALQLPPLALDADMDVNVSTENGAHAMGPSIIIAVVHELAL